MKTRLLFAAVSGLLLVSASPPPPGDPIPWEDEESLAGYPPCSATVTDRCIQTYERGVGTRDNMARNTAPAPTTAPPKSYASTSTAAAGDYPPCSATVTDRCVQTNERGTRGSVTRMARAPKPKYRTQPMRMAMRAGERG